MTAIYGKAARDCILTEYYYNGYMLLIIVKTDVSMRVRGPHQVLITGFR
ncbi:MAG TPA: hypothetical protein VED16_02470 [Candidatus Acidoferrum sp.]|nr:hypothetical protein [Candidatus Acidoferrum sp.]